MKTKQCHIGRVSIHYRVVDDRAESPTGGASRESEGSPRTAIVCAGGLGGTHLIWSGMVRVLRKQYPIVIWDYPGLGAGTNRQEIGALERIAVDVPELVRYQRAVMDAEKLDRVCLVGWSLGTQVDIEFARAHSHRVSALVAICGVAGRSFMDPTKIDPFASTLGVNSQIPGAAISWLSERMERIETLRSMLRRIEHPTRWAKRLGLVDNLVDDLIFDAVIRDFLELDTRTYWRYAEASAEHDASDLLDQLPFPVLLVAGERDRFLRPGRVEEMGRHIPHSEYFEVKGATHFLPLEYFDLLSLKIDHFLKRQKPL